MALFENICGLHKEINFYTFSYKIFKLYITLSFAKLIMKCKIFGMHY